MCCREDELPILNYAKATFLITNTLRLPRFCSGKLTLAFYRLELALLDDIRNILRKQCGAPLKLLLVSPQ